MQKKFAFLGNRIYDPTADRAQGEQGGILNHRTRRTPFLTHAQNLQIKKTPLPLFLVYFITDKSLTSPF